MTIRGAPSGLPTRSNALELFPSMGSLSGRVTGFFAEKKTLCAIMDRLALGADRPEACRGGSAPAPRSRTVQSCAVERLRLHREHRYVVRSSVWRTYRRQHSFWRLRWGQGCLDLLKIDP
jgi:hypothetical protein